MIKIADRTAMARSAEKPGASGVDVDSISPVEDSRIWPGSMLIVVEMFL
jgi:hypothetical protein